MCPLGPWAQVKSGLNKVSGEPSILLWLRIWWNNFKWSRLQVSPLPLFPPFLLTLSFFPMWDIEVTLALSGMLTLNPFLASSCVFFGWTMMQSWLWLLAQGRSCWGCHILCFSFSGPCLSRQKRNIPTALFEAGLGKPQGFLLCLCPVQPPLPTGLSRLSKLWSCLVQYSSP